MLKTALLLVACLSVLAGYSQPYIPIPVNGFNEDVIAEGAVASSLATTSREMDALVPSNYVVCTQQFATFNSIPTGYGLPDNGSITSGTKAYQLAPLGDGSSIQNNALYLLKTEFGTLTLQTPATYKSLSFLVTATEGAATVTATVNYTDGTNQAFSLSISDWVGTTTNIISGFGRIKRIAGPFIAGTYEMGGVNPKLYSIEVSVSCSKMVGSVDFTNTSGGTGTASNRAFIFAISGDTTGSPIPPVVIATPDTLCSGQTTVLSVQSPSGSLTYNWYTASTGGTVAGTGTSYTTPALNATTTYYGESTNSGGCSSTRTPVVVTIRPAPVKATADTARICSGQTATLTVTNSIVGNTYSWYQNSTGGTALSTGTTYTTPALTANTTYYIEVTSIQGCINASRTAVVVIVTPLPAAPTATAADVCPGQTTIINITSPDPAITYSYYTVSSGGTAIATGTSFTTPPVTGPVTYYIEASNGQGCISATRTTVNITNLPEPAAPIATATPVCPGQTSTISITTPDPAITYSYYTASSGGTAIATGTSFTTPPVTGTVTYFIEATGSAGCISSTRTAVTIPFSPSPAAPVATAATVCAGQTTTIIITSPDPALTYTYYVFPTGGTAVGTGTSYTTGAVSGPFTYYVQSTSAGGCTSPTRTAVTLSLYPTPQPPPAITYDEFCNGQAATIVLLNPDPTLTYGFYTVASGGSPVGTGTSYTTPAITGPVTYYVQATNGNGCNSARSFIIVNFTPPPAPPVVTAAQVCSGKQATIYVTNPDTIYTYSYYTTPTGGTPVGTGDSYTTPPISSTVTYYVETTINSAGCISNTRTPITLTVTSVLATPVVTATTITASSITFSWGAIPGASGYQVSVNGGGFTTPSSGSTGLTHTITGLSTGERVTIRVRATGAVECEASAGGLATAVVPSTEIFIPNTFTPNGDGTNDVFVVYGKSVSALNMRIFNQWGALVYSSAETTKGWDGTYKGKLAPVGVYVYVADITVGGGIKILKKGTINLVR